MYNSRPSVTDEMINFLNQQDLRTSSPSVSDSGIRETIKPSVDPDVMRRNVELFDQRLAEAGINMEELSAILNSTGHTMIDAAAGAGKTTAIILLLIRGMLSGSLMKVVYVPNGYGGHTPTLVPAKILVSTFLKSGAKDLRRSFYQWCNRLGVAGLSLDSVTFSTLHAEVAAAIKALGINLNFMEGSEDDEILKHVMRQYGIRSKMAISRNITVDEVMEVKNIVQYARNRLDPQRFNHPAMPDYNMDAIMLSNLLQETKNYRVKSGRYDFDDMNEMVLEAANANPAISNFLASRYDVIIIDEFQDTSQLQYEVFKHYFRGVARIIVIGDVDQIIYSWRGSDGNIMLKRFVEEYNPQILPLSTNYRCRENILNFVKPSIVQNKERLPKDLRAFKPGGEVRVVYDGNIEELVKNIHADLAAGRSVGVIARSNASLLVPALLLELDGTVKYSLSKSVSMNSRLPKQIFGMISLLTKPYTSEFETLLRTFAPRYAWNEVQQLVTVIKNNRISLFDIPDDDIRQSLRNLSNFLLNLKRTRREMGDVEAYLYILMYMERYCFTGSSVYAQNARDLLAFVRQIILEHEKVSQMDIHQLEMLFTSTLPGTLMQRIRYASEENTDEFRCKLTTGHEAKGKEWDSVYVWNDVVGAFPVSSGNRDLTPQELEEERRLHYIACTRAKDVLTIFTRRGLESPFLKECDHSLVGVVTEISPTSTVTREPVFRKRNEGEQPPSPAQRNAEILRKFISGVLSGARMDSLYYNVLAVESAVPFDELLVRLEPYGVTLTPDTANDVLAVFFQDQASLLQADVSTTTDDYEDDPNSNEYDF